MQRKAKPHSYDQAMRSSVMAVCCSTRGYDEAASQHRAICMQDNEGSQLKHMLIMDPEMQFTVSDVRHTMHSALHG
jgi:hypothetical protein